MIMQEITNNLVSYIEQQMKSIQEVLFVPIDAHPVWEDNDDILELADKQILQPAGPRPEEEILAYIGMHAKTIITGKRDSVGFLVTNLRILTQIDFPGIFFSGEIAKSTWFIQEQSADDVLPVVWEDFIGRNKLPIPAESLSAMQSAITNVVKIVLPQLQNSGSLPYEIVKANNIKDRLKELALQPVLKTFEQEEKKLKKFAEKNNVSGIRFGTVDKPLFGGVYGFVITEAGIVSRNLMEDIVVSSWKDILKDPATVGEKRDHILAGGKTHIVPPHHKEFVSAIIILVNEIASGEILI